MGKPVPPFLLAASHSSGESGHPLTLSSRSFMRASLFLCLCLIAGGLVLPVPLSGQIAVGGKQFVRSPAEAGKKGEWVL